MALVNRKNISTGGFDEDALTTSTQGDNTLNFGNLTTAGDLADGIVAARHRLIINFAQIETSGLGATNLVEGSSALIRTSDLQKTSGNDDLER
jgi:hypothetical protein